MDMTLETLTHVATSQQAQTSSDELVERLSRAISHEGTTEPLPGITLRRAHAPTELGHSVSDPAFCVTAQGSKEVVLGANRYRYDPAHYLITTATLPVASRIVEAAPDRPYLNVVIKLDPSVVGSVMVDSGHTAAPAQSAATAINVSPLDAGLLDAVVRLLRLLDTPTEARFLAPLITREIVYRLLLGEQGDRLRHIPMLGGSANRIIAAVERLRNELDQPLRIEEVARDLGMSVSGFHHHFKAVTTMSPLQFQKRLRLQEARRLILAGDYDAASAGYRVGYRDPSHFNREYKSVFGVPPMRDVQRLRAAGRVDVEA